MNLQSSLEVTSPLGSPDLHLLLILIVMLLAGVLGGLVNYYLMERKTEGDVSPDWRRHLIFGVGAALTAPLVLNMLSSHLLDAARLKLSELYIFGGFCLIYVVLTRRLFDNPLGKVQAQLKALQQELLRQQDELLALQQGIASGELAQEKQEPREVVTYNDVELLRALAEESYVYGNLAALTEKTGLGRELVSQRLGILKNLGLIDTRINDRNVLHWVISSRGKQVLTDILTGQDESKKVA